MDTPKPSTPEETVPAFNSKSIEEFWTQNLLENHILPTYLPKQRWFRSKARTIELCTLEDIATIGEGIYVTLVKVKYKKGKSEIYCMPLKITRGDACEAVVKESPKSILANIEISGQKAILHDVLADTSGCHTIFNSIFQNQKCKSSHGELKFFTTPSSTGHKPTRKKNTPIKHLGTDQSNTSLLFDRLVLKFFRQLSMGTNPDMEVGLFLTEKTYFSNVPRVMGGIEYESVSGEKATLAILQNFIQNQGDGWQFTLDNLAKFFQKVSSSLPRLGEEVLAKTTPLQMAMSKIPQQMSTLIGDYKEEAYKLGERTAELHNALASSTDDPAFNPKKIGKKYMRRLAKGAIKNTREVLLLLQGHLYELPESIRPKAHEVLLAKKLFMEYFKNLTELKTDAVAIRCHGDYHLGQVMRTEDDFIILDFEGEPLRSLKERRRKHCPLKDLAGMVRSYHYAASKVLMDITKNNEEEFTKLSAYANLWFRGTVAHFFRGYLNSAKNAPFLPTNPDHLAILLEAFILDKALYELKYEINNRPDWVYIPLQGVVSFIEHI